MLTYSDNGKHHLSHVESVPPVVIGDIAIILFDAQQPPAQDTQLDVKSPDKIQLHEHPETSL